MIVDIIPEIKTAYGQGVFSYSVPKELEKNIRVGSIATIPFGKKKILGVVAETQNKLIGKTNYKIKEIISINQSFSIPEIYIEISKWISDYYLCSLGEAISIFMPPELSQPRRKKEETIEKKQKLNQLTSEQKKIFEKLSQKLFSEKKKPALIYGVTGSGKTEIYLHLARKTVDSEKCVIMLVPEIVLTPQNIERFKEIFGQDVALMHSGLSKSEKLHCYQSFYSGEKKIIVGPRSALLVPNKNIGLIIIDEEQEDSYKQEQAPRYDAVTLAEVMAQKLGALLILGSATPRIETYFKAKKGLYDLFKIAGRYNSLMLPTSEIIDLKNEIKKENFSSISERLQDSLAHVLKTNQQAILFLNRRGMSTYVSCRDCGEVINCDRCDVPMVYHFDQRGNYFACHHCDKRAVVPTKCPNCGGLRIKYFGSGVEKVENEILELFPKAKIKRVDSRVLQSHADYEKFYQDFKNHKFDIVIGTQILAKGFDIPNVALVGIISADVGLHLPHFRATEKIFRVLTQISGRSGRREKSGHTIIQSYWPNSPAISYASNHDFENFYGEEIKKREKKNYPPTTHIIRVLSENISETIARDGLMKLSEDLKRNHIDFVGPGACFFQRLNNKFRFQIIIKSETLPNSKISELYKKYPNFVWDVDALNLL